VGGKIEEEQGRQSRMPKRIRPRRQEVVWVCVIGREKINGWNSQNEPGPRIGNARLY